MATGDWLRSLRGCDLTNWTSLSSSRSNNGSSSSPTASVSSPKTRWEKVDNRPCIIASSSFLRRSACAFCLPDLIRSLVWRPSGAIKYMYIYDVAVVRPRCRRVEGLTPCLHHNCSAQMCQDSLRCRAEHAPYHTPRTTPTPHPHIMILYIDMRFVELSVRTYSPWL